MHCNDAKLHTAYYAFQDATNPSIVDSHFVQGHQEIPPKTRNQTKWLIELCTLRQEMESDASNATIGLISYWLGNVVEKMQETMRFGPNFTFLSFCNIILCVYPHCKVSIGQYNKMCTSPLIFFSSIISDDKYLKKIFDNFHFHFIFDHLSLEQSQP